MERVGHRDHPLAQPARMLIVLLICAAALAALAASRPTTPSTSSSIVGGPSHSRLVDIPLTVSTLNVGHIACPSGIAYTPDSKAFAMLGFQGDCTPGNVGSQRLVV